MKFRGLLTARCMLLACMAGCRPSPESPPFADAPAQPKMPAPDMSVFGVVALGEPLRLPKCRSNDDPRACVNGRAVDGSTRVHIESLGEGYRYDWNIDVREVDGTAEIVMIRSLNSFGDDTAMYDQLASKYGPPTESGKHDDLAAWAIWELSELWVYWQGRGLNLDHGTAVISTPKGRDYTDRERARKDAASPKL